MEERQLIIRNDIGELERLAVFMEEACAAWGLGPDLEFLLNLVGEEAISNTILYGYDEGQVDETITVDLALHEDVLTLRFTDSARPFNPLLAPPPDDLDKPAGERKIGGLGIYIIKQKMDTVEYQRTGNKNVLILTRKINLNG